MSGHNGIAKFARTNRDGELIQTAVRGAYVLSGNSSKNAASPLALTAGDLLSGKISFGAGSVGPYTMPTGKAIEDVFELQYPLDVETCIQGIFINETNQPITIQLPGTVAGQGSLATCDGSNVLIIDACEAVEYTICRTGPDQYVQYLLGQVPNGGGGPGITNAVNLGIGCPILAGIVGTTLQLKSIDARDGLTCTNNPNEVAIDFDGVNIGVGSEVFFGIAGGVGSGGAAQFRRINGGPNITVTQNPNDITIEGAAPANGINLGVGSQVLAQVNPVTGDLEFRTLLGQDGILLTQLPNEIEIDFDAVNIGLGAQVFALFNGAGQAQFRTLTAGPGSIVTQNANDITISTIPVTQQIAFDNSEAIFDTPTINIDQSLYPFTYRPEISNFVVGYLDSHENLAGDFVARGRYCAGSAAGPLIPISKRVVPFTNRNFVNLTHFPKSDWVADPLLRLAGAGDHRGGAMVGDSLSRDLIFKSRVLEDVSGTLFPVAARAQYLSNNFSIAKLRIGENHHCNEGVEIANLRKWYLCHHDNNVPNFLVDNIDAAPGVWCRGSTGLAGSLGYSPAQFYTTALAGMGSATNEDKYHIGRFRTLSPANGEAVVLVDLSGCMEEFGNAANPAGWQSFNTLEITLTYAHTGDAVEDAPITTRGVGMAKWYAYSYRNARGVSFISEVGPGAITGAANRPTLTLVNNGLAFTLTAPNNPNANTEFWRWHIDVIRRVQFIRTA